MRHNSHTDTDENRIGVVGLVDRARRDPQKLGELLQHYYGWLLVIAKKACTQDVRSRLLRDRTFLRDVGVGTLTH